MPIEVRFSAGDKSIGTLVVSRTYPDVPMPPDQGVGVYTATLATGSHVATVEGIRHVRADGAVALVRRALNALNGIDKGDAQAHHARRESDARRRK